MKLGCVQGQAVVSSSQSKPVMSEMDDRKKGHFNTLTFQSNTIITKATGFIEKEEHKACKI